MAFIAAVAGLTIASLEAQPTVSDQLRVRQITIVDANGTERVWIGAPVPEPIVQGKRMKRSGPISGIILLDAKGNERGGFATSDALPGEVFLGLDSEKRQEVRLLVNPGGSGHLSFFDDQNNFARIGISTNQRPTLLLREKGEVVFQAPTAK